jgi:very-short-patch-repair endonuclease
LRRPESEDTDACLEIWAQGMRWLPTPEELKLRPHLEILGFKNQVPIYTRTKNGGVFPAIMDFYHEAAKLCVEVDGGIHSRQRGRDRRRGMRLQYDGIKTIRFTNREVLANPRLVAYRIQQELRDRLE